MKAPHTRSPGACRPNTVQLRRRSGYRSIVRVFAFPEELHDPLDVGTCLRKRWDAPIPIDGAFPSVIGRSHERDVALEIGKQPPQVRESAAHVLHGVERLSDVEARGGL